MLRICRIASAACSSPCPKAEPQYPALRSCRNVWKRTSPQTMPARITLEFCRRLPFSSGLGLSCSSSAISENATAKRALMPASSTVSGSSSGLMRSVSKMPSASCLSATFSASQASVMTTSPMQLGVARATQPNDSERLLVIVVMGVDGASFPAAIAHLWPFDLAGSDRSASSDAYIPCGVRVFLGCSGSFCGDLFQCALKVELGAQRSDQMVQLDVELAHRVGQFLDVGLVTFDAHDERTAFRPVEHEVAPLPAGDPERAL